jgi:hypothetical protein
MDCCARRLALVPDLEGERQLAVVDDPRCPPRPSREWFRGGSGLSEALALISTSSAFNRPSSSP